MIVPFLEKSPTSFHAAKEIEKKLLSEGFTPLQEEESWHLEKGKSYFLCRSGTLVAAFRMPQNTLEGATLFATHLDSPSLKIKPNPEEIERDLRFLAVELYGAPLLYTWFDRDLCIAGRVLGNRGEVLIHSQQERFFIPSVAIHLNREVNEKGLLVHKEDHLKAFFSSRQEPFLSWLKKEAAQEEIFGFDLFLCPTSSPAWIGTKQELLASSQLDNLASAFALLEAICSKPSSPHQMQLALFWDHEEIGSETATGAGSLFAQELLERICQFDRELLYRIKKKSLILSIDLAHSFNPNYKEKYDLKNSPHFDKGVALKWNANQKYATNSLGASRIYQRAKEKGICLQNIANRSDLPSGSTVGSIMAANLGIETIDIGIGCWGMHSTREVISRFDLEQLQALLVAIE